VTRRRSAVHRSPGPKAKGPPLRVRSEKRAVQSKRGRRRQPGRPKDSPLHSPASLVIANPGVLAEHVEPSPEERVRLAEQLLQDSPDQDSEARLWGDRARWPR